MSSRKSVSLRRLTEYIHRAIRKSLWLYEIFVSGEEDVL